MKLWQAIEEIAKDNSKIFIRAKKHPVDKLMLYFQSGGLLGGIRIANSTNDTVAMLPMEIMDGWEER